MGNAPLWLTEADVTRCMDVGAAIDALETVLAVTGADAGENMGKTHLMVGANDVLQAIGGAVPSEGLCGTKTWVNVGGKSQTLVLLFSLTDGSLKCVVEATALGQMRTAAMTGLGTKWLSPEDAGEMAIIGTGKQALPQIAACMAVRPIKKVRIYSRAEASREALAEAAAIFPGLKAVPAASLEEATDGVPLITLCTNATEAFFGASMAAKGAHINAIGAIVPGRVEFTEDIFPRCSMIAVDTLDGVKAMSREFMDYFGAAKDNWDKVVPISVVMGESRRRPADADLTLFKAMGMGLADIAVAIEVLKRNEIEGAAHRLPERIKMQLPLT
ncbi:MAG: ornithine cyclodeaminase family protein [Rhodospirillaceae bacterium]|nr:ornithine cyclodeaminase family protein [Rhodospirillaceae bacterium]